MKYICWFRSLYSKFLTYLSDLFDRLISQSNKNNISINFKGINIIKHKNRASR